MKTTIAFLLLSGAAAMCPFDGGCSGHGNCGVNDKCSCYKGYRGNACEQRTCDHSISWNIVAEEATSSITDKTGGSFKLVTHTLEECSSKGECDRDSGECKCFDGYTGKGCRRMKCDDDCSGHGRCKTLYDVARDMSWAGGYTGWDAHKIQQCTCDPGWEGISCSSRMCPKGDDPLTTGQVPTTIFLGTGRFAGADASTPGTANRPGFQSADTTPVLVPGLEFVLEYTDSFNNKFYTSAISGVDTSAIEIEEALERLPSHAIPDITVTVVESSTTDGVSPAEGGTADQYDATNFMNIAISGTSSVNMTATSTLFSITFNSPANSGPQALAVHTLGCAVHGCQPLYHGTGYITGSGRSDSNVVGSGAKIWSTTGFSGTIAPGSVTNTVVVGTTELATCANRGECDGSTGECECYPGYHGVACEAQSTVV